MNNLEYKVLYDLIEAGLFISIVKNEGEMYAMYIGDIEPDVYLGHSLEEILNRVKSDFCLY